jgi:hypothetical protein
MNTSVPSNQPDVPHGEPPFQILFVSRMAPGHDFGIVKRIVTGARRANLARGISGALLFDGERFCELIEGAEADVRALLQTVSQDPRHTHVSVLHEGPAAAGRAVPAWVCGYCDGSDLEALGSDTGLRDRPALEAFLAVLRGADVV